MRPLVGTAWTALGLGVVAVASFLTAILATRHLGPAGFGRYAYLTWLAETLGALATLGLARPVARFAARLHRDGEDDLARRTTLAAGALTGFVGVALGAVLSTLSSVAVSSSALLVVLVSLYSAGAGTSSVIGAGLQGMFRFRTAALVGLTGPTLLLLGTTTVVLARGDAGAQYLAATIAASVAAMTGLGLLYRGSGDRPRKDRAQHGFSIEAFRSYWGYSAVLVLIELTVWQRSEVWFLQRFRSAAEVGLYTAAFAVASRFALVSAVFAPVLYSTAASLVQERQDEAKLLRLHYSLATRWLALVSMPVLFVGAALSGRLVVLLFGSDFETAAVPLALLLAGGAVTAFSVPGAAVMYGTDRMPFVVRWGAIAAAVTVLAALILIPSLGVLGAAAGNLSGQLVAVVATYRLSLRPDGFRIPARSLLQIAACAVLGATAAIGVLGLVTGLGGAILGAAVALTAYCVLLRLFGVFDHSDRLLLLRIESHTPATLRWLLRPVQYLVDPERPA